MTSLASTDKINHTKNPSIEELKLRLPSRSSLVGAELTHSEIKTILNTDSRKHQSVATTSGTSIEEKDLLEWTKDEQNNFSGTYRRRRGSTVSAHPGDFMDIHIAPSFKERVKSKLFGTTQTKERSHLYVKYKKILNKSLSNTKLLVDSLGKQRKCVEKKSYKRLKQLNLFGIIGPLLLPFTTATRLELEYVDLRIQRECRLCGLLVDQVAFCDATTADSEANVYDLNVAGRRSGKGTIKKEKKKKVVGVETEEDIVVDIIKRKDDKSNINNNNDNKKIENDGEKIEKSDKKQEDKTNDDDDSNNSNKATVTESFFRLPPRLLADDQIGSELLNKITDLENKLTAIRKKCAELTQEYVVDRSLKRRGQQLLGVLVIPQEMENVNSTSETKVQTETTKERLARKEVEEWQQAVFESIVADQRTRDGRLLNTFFSVHLATQMKQYQIFGNDCLPPPTTLIAFCNYLYQIISAEYSTVLEDVSGSGSSSLLDNPKVQKRLKVFISRLVFRRK